MATDYVVGLYEGLVLAETVKVPRGALKFTNTSGQLRLGTGPSSGSSFSFCSWVKITTDTNAYALWLSLQGASTTYWEAGFDTTGTGSIVNDAFTERAVGINFTVGTWYFFGVSQSSGNCKVMIGTEGGTLTKFTSTLANLTLPLSEKLYGGELSVEALAGAMSEARFWNAALTDAEFLAEYYSAVQARTSNAGGYHKLENTSTKLTDSSAASNNLTAPTGTGTWAFEPGPDIAPAPSGSPFENVAMAETIDAVYTPGSGGSYTGDVNETVTVSEALAAIRGAIAGLSETDSLSEATAAVLGAIAGLSETVTLSESAAVAYAAVVATPETVALGEALGSQSNEASGLTETVTLSESMSGGTAFTAGTSETVSVSESAAAVYAATAATSETVSVGESSGSQSATASSLGETVTLSELLAGGSAYASGLSETVTASEGGAFTYSAIVAPTETVTNSESVTGIQSGGGGTAYTGDVNETVTISEAIGVVYASAIATAERVALSSPIMSELGTTDLHLVAEDWTPGSNWVSRVGGFTAALNGALTKQAEGGIERDGLTGFSASNYFSLAANAAHEFTPSTRFTYEFVIRGGAAGGNLFGRYASPFAGGYDISAFSASAALGIYNDDGSAYYAVAVGATALVDDSYYLVTVVLDGAADQFKLYINGAEDASENSVPPSILTNGSPAAFFLGNSNGNNQPFDGSIIEVVRHRAALTPSEVRDRYQLNMVAAGKVSTAATAETVSVSDATAGVYGAKPSIAETLSISDATTLSQVLAQGLPETVTLSDGATALAALARAVNETVSLAESLASAIVSAYTLSETVNLSEAVALSQVLANALAEAVTLAEAMIGYIPRVLVTELGEPVAVKTAYATVAPVVAVETDAPASVKTGSTTLLGLP